MKKTTRFLPHFLAIDFPPHIRLIILFIGGFGLSFMSRVSLLLSLNAVALVLLIGLLVFYQQSYRAYFKRFLLLHSFSLCIWLTMSWRWDEGGQIYPLGMQTALLITLKMNLLLFMVWILLFNLNDSLLVQAIGRLPLPKKFIRLFVFTVRYIALLSQLKHKMFIAMQARGYQHKFTTRTFMVVTQMVVLLLINALNKLEKVEMALKARGFK